MAFENLFIRTKKSIGGIQLDAVISESHSNVVRITKNPVEVGVDTNDHAVIEPKKITIIAEVSDTPLGFAALTQIVDLLTGLFGSSTSGNITRSITAYNALVQIQEARQTIEVQTKLKEYKDMLITNISTFQDKDSSRIVSMSIQLEELIVTPSEVVQIDKSQLKAGPTKSQAASAENKGKQEPISPSPAKEKSYLKMGSNILSGS